MRPVVLLTCSGLRTRLLDGEVPSPPVRFTPDWPCKADQFGPDRNCLKICYIRAVEEAGGAPLLLPNSPYEEAAVAAVSACDALLLTGGWDIAPACYGAQPHAKLGKVDELRDISELAATREALRLGRPIFAICRGIQLLNVAMGGTLIQDIPSHFESLGKAPLFNHQDPTGRHDIQIDAATTLAGLWGTSISVNTRHHQALDRLADGLKVTARATDGIIEAAESSDNYPLLAVQSHPEDLWADDRRYLRPFEWLIEQSCAAR